MITISTRLPIPFLVCAAISCSSTGSVGGESGEGGAAPVPTTVPPHAPPGSCGLDHPAFCEDFETVHAGGRGGDLDESMWSFTRWGHETRQHYVRNPSSAVDPLDSNALFPPTFCGKSFSGILMPNDVVACDGTGLDGLTSHQLNEVYWDQGDFAINSMRVRQLFDFTDRTGTVVFDVDAKVNPLNLGHGWWVEFWITDDTAPMPYHEALGVLSYPKNGVGINFQGLNNCPQGRNATTIARVFVTKNNTILHDIPGWELKLDSDEARCIKVEDGKLNRFKVLINKDSAEIWASDAGDVTTLHRIATAPTLDLPFTRGYVHFQHSQYNAHKDGAVTPIQTYRWDNIGFDGPSYAVPKSYTFPENTGSDIDGSGGVAYGYQLGQPYTLQVDGVDLSGATKASLDFTIQALIGETFNYNFNGGPSHVFTIPSFQADNREGLRGFALDVPVSELKNGTNSVTFQIMGTYTSDAVADLELSLQ